jgi:hypothetical protein
MAQSQVHILSAPDRPRRFVAMVSGRSFQPARAALLRAILDDVICHQHAFLDFGPVWIFEDSLRSLADRIGSTESQVSRAVKAVIVSTQHGNIALRDLFRPGVPLIHGVRRVSQYSVAWRIERLVEREVPGRPYSDEELSDLLAKEGLAVARRTVAKYRALRGVPDSRRRRGGEWVRDPPKKPPRPSRAAGAHGASAQENPPPSKERGQAVLQGFHALARRNPKVWHLTNTDVARLLRASGLGWISADDVADIRGDAPPR